MRRINSNRIVLLLILSASLCTSAAQGQDYSPLTMVLNVYSDGSVNVEYVVEPEPTLARVNVTLPGEPYLDVLVVDSGTCITFGFVNSKSEYLGGAISPGIEMRFKAVNAYTANLPLLRPEAAIPDKADSTTNAIQRGILNGVICEIDGTINQYAAEYLTLTVVLTGGDVNFLANSLKSSIFAIPNFLLEGLNSILIHNS